jgi:phosphoribosylanthranilate isomerase
MIIKICGITNLDDARLAVDEGASALGFVFYPRSPRAVDEETVARITAALPKEVWKVGVFVNENPDRILRIAQACGLDVVQLHGDEPPLSRPFPMRVWKAFRVGPDGPAVTWPAELAEAFVFDAQAGEAYGGAGKTFPWVVARGFPAKVILAGGLDAANVAEAVRQAQPWGVDASSRLESVPGRKDPAKLRAFLQAARAISQL